MPGKASGTNTFYRYISPNSNTRQSPYYINTFSQKDRKFPNLFYEAGVPENKIKQGQLQKKTNCKQIIMMNKMLKFLNITLATKSY